DRPREDPRPVAAGTVADDGKLEVAGVVVQSQVADRVPVFPLEIELRPRRPGPRPGRGSAHQTGGAEAEQHAFHGESPACTARARAVQARRLDWGVPRCVAPLYTHFGLRRQPPPWSFSVMRRTLTNGIPLLFLALLFLNTTPTVQADFPSAAQLPSRPALPDPLAMLNGGRVATKEQWF